MSKTDKDRPDWVIRHVEGFPIDHDHRNGRCVEETIEYARAVNSGSYKRNWKHNCLKRVKTEYYCTKDAPYKPYRTWRKGSNTTEETVCWNEWEIPTAWVGARYPGNRNGFLHRTKHTECVGPHTRYVFYDEIPCACNGWPPVPTCDPSWHGVGMDLRYFHMPMRGKSTSAYCRSYYHKPERRRERDAAQNWVKEFNAGAEFEDWDFDNRQGRHSVLWDLD